jgi:bacterial/archaeal transporter family protein
VKDWFVPALLSALFAGLVAIFGKMGVREVDSATATTARSLVMSVFLIGVVCFRGQFGQLSAIPGKSWWFVILAGVSGALSWLFYFEALKHGDATKVAPVDRLSILLTAILAWMFLGEKISWMVAAGLLLVLVGVLLVTKG